MSPVVFTIGMTIEWDPDKREENRKHGYLFESVEDWLSRVLLPTHPGGAPPTVGLTYPRRDYGEDRETVVTVDWEGNPVLFVFTVRGQNLRIISYRRASQEEATAFYEHHMEADVRAWLDVAYKSTVGLRT